MSVTVYELIENKLQRIYVGQTELAVEQEYVKLRTSPPGALSGWDWTNVQMRPVETFESAKLAGEFLKRYASKTPPPGWAVLSG